MDVEGTGLRSHRSGLCEVRSVVSRERLDGINNTGIGAHLHPKGPDRGSRPGWAARGSVLS
jgi:hypothetical protein